MPKGQTLIAVAGGISLIKYRYLNSRYLHLKQSPTREKKQTFLGHGLSDLFPSSTLGGQSCPKESLILSTDNKGRLQYIAHMQTCGYLKVGEVNPMLVNVWVRAACKVRRHFCASVCDWAACLRLKKVEGTAFLASQRQLSQWVLVSLKLETRTKHPLKLNEPSKHSGLVFLQTQQS